MGLVLASLLLTTAAVTVTASPAAAATGCGSNCDGRDPKSFRIYTGPNDWYTCADDGFAKLRAEYWNGGVLRFYVDLMYSPRCRTAWAETSYFGSYILVERQSPYRLEDAYPNTDRSPIWTRMVNDAGYVSRACVSIGAGGEVCTNWF
jgi:hypothetical protein